MPIGLGIVLAFLISLFWLVKPANWRELIIFALGLHVADRDLRS
jgi:hypothetical protein